MEFTASFIVFILAVQLGAYFVKGLAGFGDPLITSPFLAMTNMQINQISLLTLLLGWPINLYMSFINRKSFSIKKTLPMILCNLCGMVPGVIFLKYFSSWILKVVLGLILLFCGIEMLTRKESKNSGNPLTMAIVSIISGFCSGIFGINLFFVAYIERTGYVNRNQFRGQMCFLFLIENTVRIIISFCLGLFNVTIYKLALISLLGVVGGLLIGSKVDTKLSDKTIRKIITIVFMCAGLSTLIKAIITKS